MKNKSIITIGIILLLLAAISIIVARMIAPKPVAKPLVITKTVRDTNVRYETEIKYIPSKPVVITKFYPVYIESKTDSTLVAVMDTIVSKDTVSFNINIAGRFCDTVRKPNIYVTDFSVRRPQDSILIQKVIETITLTNTVEERRPWYVDAATHICVGILCYGAGRLMK